MVFECFFPLQNDCGVLMIGYCTGANCLSAAQGHNCCLVKSFFTHETTVENLVINALIKLNTHTDQKK